MVKDASGYLSKTLGNRFHFKEVTILVPSNWETQPKFKRAKTQTYERVWQKTPISGEHLSFHIHSSTIRNLLAANQRDKPNTTQIEKRLQAVYLIENSAQHINC